MDIAKEISVSVLPNIEVSDRTEQISRTESQERGGEPNQSRERKKERNKRKREQIRQVMWVVRSGRTRGQLSLKQILKSLRTKKQKNR